MLRSPYIHLIAEDALGLALGRRLVKEHSQLIVWRETIARGNVEIKKRIQKYNQMAQNGCPVLILTDLDFHACGRQLLDEWFGRGCSPAENLLIRICVREAEAWLMADPKPLARLLGVPIARMPIQPETLDDPKRFLLGLAAFSPLKVRKGLLPPQGSTATIGPEYNELLCPLVAKWDISRAASRAPSLTRARQRLAELVTRLPAPD